MHTTGYEPYIQKNTKHHDAKFGFMLNDGIVRNDYEDNR